MAVCASPSRGPKPLLQYRSCSPFPATIFSHLCKGVSFLALGPGLRVTFHSLHLALLRFASLFGCFLLDRITLVTFYIYIGIRRRAVSVGKTIRMKNRFMDYLPCGDERLREHSR